MSGDFLAPHSKDRKKLNKLAAFYGVDGFDYQGQDEGETGFGPKGRPGSYNGAKVRVENRTTKDVARDINTAMANGAMGDYLRYSGKSLPMADDYEGLFALHKDAKKAHKEIGGNNYNNAGSDNFKLANHAFKEWESKLNSNTGGKGEEETSSETPNPTGQSWNDAVANGSLSPAVMAAHGRLEERRKQRQARIDNPSETGLFDWSKGLPPETAAMTAKATSNTPTPTPATRAQAGLSDAVKGVASLPKAINKSKNNEKAFLGMGFGGAALNYVMGHKPRTEAEQAMKDTFMYNSATNAQNYQIAKASAAQQNAYALNNMQMAAGLQFGMGSAMNAMGMNNKFASQGYF